MSLSVKSITRKKHTLDAQGQVLGRLASQAAELLVGKSKPDFVRHLDCGDFVTITSAQKITTTGKKETKKTYTRYSGYPGGLKKILLKDLRVQNPSEMVRHAVSGMLPNNKLKKFWLSRLEIKN